MEIEGKNIELFSSERPDAPLVLLHTVMGEGEAVWRATRELTNVSFSLAAIGNLDWDGDMSPWPIPPITKGDTPCSGGRLSHHADRENPAGRST